MQEKKGDCATTTKAYAARLIVAEPHATTRTSSVEREAFHQLLSEFLSRHSPPPRDLLAPLPNIHRATQLPFVLIRADVEVLWPESVRLHATAPPRVALVPEDGAPDGLVPARLGRGLLVREPWRRTVVRGTRAREPRVGRTGRRRGGGAGRDPARLVHLHVAAGLADDRQRRQAAPRGPLAHRRQDPSHRADDDAGLFGPPVEPAGEDDVGRVAWQASAAGKATEPTVPGTNMIQCLNDPFPGEGQTYSGSSRRGS